jgi:D-alanyl-D-alanine carboxypeptidase/D-alanyl-D-alanine-endopeptidase (penicillin-binding protein 4)
MLQHTSLTSARSAKPESRMDVRPSFMVVPCRFVFLGLAFLLLTSGTGLAGLAERIHKIASPADSECSVYVVRPDSGAVLYSANAKKPLIPASNMKLVTTAAAVKYLGPNFEYKTRVGLRDGSLVVIGSGDPLLGDKVTDDKYGREGGWVFRKIAQTLQAQGIREVNDIIVDATVFDDQRVHPNWLAKDLNKWYACEVCGLNYNANCIEVVTTNVGGTIALDIEPKTRFLEITNEVRPTSANDNAVGAYRTSVPNKITVFGKCRTKDGPFKVAIEQPAAFFGTLLAEHLTEAGLTVRGKVREDGVALDGRFRPLVEFVTPLADVLSRANTESLGLAAEALLKTIDAHNNPGRKGGGWAGGRSLVARYLTGLGVPTSEFVLDDGSGLSRENRLTTNAIARVLRDVYCSDPWELYRGSLAVGGEEGTIDKYFGEAKYRGKVIGKTGYISGVRSFSGVCLTNSGPYLFSIISNGPKGLSRDAINDIAKAVMDEYDTGK